MTNQERERARDIAPAGSTQPTASSAKRWRSMVVWLLLAAVLIALGWRRTNYISGTRPHIDTGVYASGGAHVLAGRVLYRDVWDHKPPMIHVINCLALALGGHTIEAVRGAERLFAVAGVLLMYLAVNEMFGSKPLAFFAGVVYLIQLFDPRVLQGGNFTEEYAVVFVLGGICAAWFARRLVRRSPAQRDEGGSLGEGGRARSAPGIAGFGLLALSGLLFCLAALTKEPFALSSLPWFVYACLAVRGSWGKRAARSAAFAVGVIAPVLLFSLYFLAHGALGDWAGEVTFNFAYAGLSKPFLQRTLGNASAAFAATGVLRTAQIFACLGIASVFSRSFLRRSGYLPLVAVAQLCLDFFATEISGLYYGHYYMQLVPALVLTMICGLAFGADVLRRTGAPAATLLLPLAAMLIFTDGGALRLVGRGLTLPMLRYEGTPLAREIDELTAPGDPVWITAHRNCSAYFESRRLSPTKWYYTNKRLFIDSWGSTKEQKIAELRAQLGRCPPKLIVTDQTSAELLQRLGVMAWINSDYAPSESGTPELTIWMRKAPGPSDLRGSQR